MFGGNFAPTGWEFCNGQLLAIANNETLFQLIGTTYGGDGQSTFGLPDLRGRLPLHPHIVQASNASADTISAPGNMLGATSGRYTGPTSLTNLNPTTVNSVGGSQAHTNMQPFLVLNWCIALQGIFPSPN